MINFQIKHEQLTAIQINAIQNVSAMILKNKTALLQKDKKKKKKRIITQRAFKSLW